MQHIFHGWFLLFWSVARLAVVMLLTPSIMLNYFNAWKEAYYAFWDFYCPSVFYIRSYACKRFRKLFSLKSAQTGAPLWRITLVLQCLIHLVSTLAFISVTTSPCHTFASFMVIFTAQVKLTEKSTVSASELELIRRSRKTEQWVQCYFPPLLATPSINVCFYICVF